MLMIAWKAYISKKNLINIAAVSLLQVAVAVNVGLLVVSGAISIAEVLIIQPLLVAENHYAVNTPTTWYLTRVETCLFASAVLAK
jgi:hypothetical protein